MSLPRLKNITVHEMHEALIALDAPVSLLHRDPVRLMRIVASAGLYAVRAALRLPSLELVNRNTKMRSQAAEI